MLTLNIVALFAVASVPACQDLEPGKDSKLNLVCLGDSHTENGVYAKVLHDVLLKAGKATEMSRTYGFGGRSAADLVALVKGDKIDLSPDPKALNVLCLMVGTNGYKVPDLKMLVELIRGKGWTVVVLTAPPRRGPDTNTGAGGPGSNGAYNDEVRKLYPKLQAGKLQSVQVVDIVPPLLDPKQAGRGEWTDAKYNGDGVHLNHEGYTLVGQTVAAALLSIFTK
jgi:lysophospholipase L1-like esterase